MSRFAKLISLKNLLEQRARHRRGQIATFLLLMVVVMLIFALTMANMGHMSVQAATISNAADSSALLLASQLASRSRVLWDSLKGSPNDGVGATKKCKSRGLLGAILAIVLAVIAIVLAPFTGGASILGITLMTQAGTLTLAGAVVLGAIGGMIGGAIGGAISGGGAGALSGAIQGLAIGAAIGAAYGAIAGLPTGVVGVGGQVPAGASVVAEGGPAALTTGTGAATITVSLPAAGSSAGLAAGGVVTSGSVVVFAGTTFGAIVAGLGVGATFFNVYIQDKLTGDAFAAVEKQLKALSEKEQTRQRVIFQAFVRTVDDPKQVPDTYDADGDGNTTELIPRFLYWWDRRINCLKDPTSSCTGSLTQLQAIISPFIKGAPTSSPMNVNYFKNHLRTVQVCAPNCLFTSLVPSGCASCSAEFSCTGTKSFDRKEIEGPPDGRVVEVARALDNASNPLLHVSWWQAGPNASALCNWGNLPCGVDPITGEETVCGNEPTGSDSIDDLSERLKSIVETFVELQNTPTAQLASQWDRLVDLFDDPADTDDMVGDLDRILNGDGPTQPGVIAIRQDIQAKEALLPNCIPNPFPSYSYNVYLNPPCRMPNGYATSDGDTYSEFNDAKNRLAQLISKAQTFRTAAQNFAANLAAQASALNVPPSFGGINPATYSWNDSQGNHTMKVEVGPFGWPRIKKSSSFLKVCLKLKDGSDMNGNKTWVQLTRTDPTFVNAAGIWPWNPFNGQVKKTSRAYFRWDKVGIKAIGWP